MPFTSDKDPRLLVAQLALVKLKSGIFGKSNVKPALNKEQTNQIISEIESQLMALKFSYMAPQELADSQQVKAIFDKSKELYLGYKEALGAGFTALPRANVLWAFRILSGLRNRLKNPGEKMSHGIDLVAVKIRNIRPADALFITRCVAGPSEFTIVTNIKSLKAGDTLAAALLPPAVVGGEVSEAMFLGSEKVENEPGSFIEQGKVNTKETDGILCSEIKAM